MRALTLTQPWAGLVASGIKLVENRPRKIIKSDDFGKRFAIHASREIDETVYKRVDEIAPGVCRAYDGSGPAIGDWWHLSRITSAVIAVATLDTSLTWPGELPAEDQRRWFFGPIGYVLRDVVALKRPVLCRGWQGFWNLAPELERAVVEQLP